MKEAEFIHMKRPKKFMKNTYKLIWSDEALNNLKNIIDYLEYKWTKKEIKKFAKLFDKQVDLIVDNPLLFPKTDKSKDIRKSVLTKHTSIYYKINKYDIELLSIFDNRQDPEKLKI